jgi:Flp pilus assembly protein TadD
MAFVFSRRAVRIPAWCVAAAVAVAACGGSEPPPRDPDLVADPPMGGAEGPAEGAAVTDFQRAEAYIKNERWADAKTYLERSLAVQPKNAQAQYYMGLVREKEGDTAGAEKSYKAALELDPALAEAAQNLAAIYLSTNPPRVDDAIPPLRQALAKAPDDVGLLQNLGYALGLKGDVEGASKAYEAALKKRDSVELHFAYASMLSDAKQYDKAATHLKKVLEATKDDAALLATVGRMLAFGKAFGDCVAAFDRALKLKSDDPEWFVRRGTCRHELGDESGAMSDYQAALKVKPDYAAAHYYAGLSLFASRKPQSAQAAMEKAVQYGGDTSVGKAAKEKLEFLKRINKK